MIANVLPVRSFVLLLTILFLLPSTAGIVAFNSDSSVQATTDASGRQLSETEYGPAVENSIETTALFSAGGIETKPGPYWIGSSTNDQSRSSRAWSGEKKVVVILTEFPDKIASTSVSTVNTRATTKLTEYYNEISYDTFTPSGTVVNSSWLMMPHNITYYTENNKAKFGEYIVDAVKAAEPLLDFDQYRTTGSYVDLLILVHSGSDEASTGNALDIWSHMSGVSQFKVDNSWIRQYCTVSEFSPLGTFVHEFGHLLGLPDLYDKDYSSNGIGVWGLMGSGSHLNFGNKPGHMSAWSKMKLGWLTPTVVSSNLIAQGIPDVERNAVAYKVPIPVHDTSSKEYFLIENRLKTGYDQYLPSSGLLIWHVDDDKYTSWVPNNDENHKLLDVEESSSVQHLDDRDNGNNGDSSDTWSSNQAGFTPDSDPNSKSYSGSDSKFYLQEISSAGSIMTADFIVRHIYFDIEGQQNRYGYPGSVMKVKFNVTSDRNGGDTIDFTLFGTVNENWAELKTTGIALTNEFDKKSVEIDVTIPNPQFPSNYCELYLRAHSTDDTEFDSEKFRVTVGQHYSFSHEILTDIALDPGESTIGSFKLFNNGNVKTGYSITITKSNDWEIVFWDSGDSGPEINAYSNRTIDIFMEVPRDAVASEQADVTITVKSLGNTAEKSFDFKVLVNKIYDLDLKTSLIKNDLDVKSGEKVQVEFTLTNEGNTLDHVNVEVVQVVHNYQSSSPWTYTINPSEKLDVTANSVLIFSFDLTVPETALAGEKQGFQVIVRSEDGVTNKTSDFTLSVEQNFGMNAVLDTYTKNIKPGKSAVFKFKITNNGNGNDTFNVSISSLLPPGWIINYPSNADSPVLPGKTQTYTLGVLSDSLSPATDYKFVIKVKSLGDESILETFNPEVEVDRVHEVEITVITEGTLVGGPGVSLNYSLSFENLGNDDELVALSGGSVPHGFVEFKKSLHGNAITSIQLQPGEEKVIIAIITLSPDIKEDGRGAVQVKGILEDQSNTNDVLLYYEADVEEKVDPGPGGGGGVEGSSLSGTVVAGIASAVIALIIIIIIFWFFVMKKGRGGKRKKKGKKGRGGPGGGRVMPQQNAQFYNGQFMPPNQQMMPQQAPQIYEGEVIQDEQNMNQMYNQYQQ